MYKDHINIHSDRHVLSQHVVNYSDTISHQLTLVIFVSFQHFSRAMLIMLTRRTPLTEQNRTEQNLLFIQGTSFEIQSIHA